MAYQADFLQGISLPVPNFTGTAPAVLDYPNYSVLMSHDGEKRSPLAVCLNVSQSQRFKTQSKRHWRKDSRLAHEHQLGNDYYKNNPWDKGHMARRAAAAWGQSQDEAQAASDETYYYTNSCLQHENLNRDEWLGLEDWVLALDLAKDGELSVFSGPFYGEHDRTVRPADKPTALIPAGFFKVVCFVHNETHQLDVRAFALYQDIEAIKDKAGRTRYNNQSYQVTITEIEALTGLRFERSIYHANPLYFYCDHIHPDENVEHLPECIEVSGPEDVIAKGHARQTVHDDIVDVFIASAMVNPAGKDSGNEWVSLINLGAKPIDVSGWMLMDQAGGALVIDTVIKEVGKRQLLAGESLVIPDVRPLRLVNTGDVIKLFDNRGARIDRVNYTQRMVKAGKPVVFLHPRDTLA